MKHRLATLLSMVSLLYIAIPATASATSHGWEITALNVRAAHTMSTGESVTVAVVDSGIRVDHPALQGRATEGKDFLRENDREEPWYGKHGTSMASSVLDVAPGAKVLGIRALRDEEDPDYEKWKGKVADPDSADGPGTLGSAIIHAVEGGADVISLSLGTVDSEQSPYYGYEAKAIEHAISKGVVVVAASGNTGDLSREESLNAVHYPAAYPGVISVAATTPDGSRSTFSSVHNYNDVAAPGVDINSADISGGRSQVNGTSSATALTAGVAALMLSKYPDLAPRQVEQTLKKTASNAGQGHNPLAGYGTIDAEAALKAAGKLRPESPALPVSKKRADIHFGPGDDGTPSTTDVGRRPEDTMVAASVGGSGLIAVIVGIILTVTGSRAQRRSSSGV